MERCSECDVWRESNCCGGGHSDKDPNGNSILLLLSHNIININSNSGILLPASERLQGTSHVCYHGKL